MIDVFVMATNHENKVENFLNNFELNTLSR